MSQGKEYLHSHSMLERRLFFPKHIVLVDEECGYLFKTFTPFRYGGILYYKVPTIEFVGKGGVFKNLSK